MVEEAPTEPSAGIDFGSFVGRTTADDVLVVERAPVAAFARSVLDENPIYHNADVAQSAGFDAIPAPPTFFFSAAESWCRPVERQPEPPSDSSDPTTEVMGALMANGGLILHGEQSFTYHRPAVVGETLHHRGRVADIYQKPTGDRTMTFMVVEHIYTDADGDPVLTATTNIIHRS